MKSICFLLILLSNPSKLLCQYNSEYYRLSNSGYQFYEEGEYEKSIKEFSKIHDTLLRKRDFIVLLNIYGNRNDTTNLLTTFSKYAKSNNDCELAYSINSISKYKHLFSNKCTSKFDSIYKEEYSKVFQIISFIDTSIKYSNFYRKNNMFDSFAKLDKDAYRFFTNCKMKEIAKAFRYLTQKEKGLYTNFFTTLIHMNYYDTISSRNVENWSKELMYYGLLEPKNFAYIVDRRIAEIGDGKQKYGEHFWKYNSEELNQINKNRAEIGLLPLK